MSKTERRKPRVLFNCTTNVKGGGVQNAANFIYHALQDERFEWIFATSHQVAEVLDSWSIRRDKFIVLDSPARSVKSRRALRELEAESSVDLVYTMAGPAYVHFKSIHVLGISNPYVTHAQWEAFVLNRSSREIALAILGALYRGLTARFEAQYWIFQTETSRTGFCRRFKVNREVTSVVPNAVGKAFISDQSTEFELSRGTSGLGVERIFCPAADYPHKNLTIIPRVARHLVDAGLDRHCFTLTLPHDSRTWEKISGDARDLSVERYIENIGPFSYADALRLYTSATVVFIPSILETFSTSYLEAIAVERLLVVADRPFAREICGDAAIYFDPRSPKSAANAILRALTNDNTESRWQEARKQVLLRYGYYNTRYEAIIRILQKILTEHTSSRWANH